MKNILRLVKYAKPYWHLLVISAVSIVAITLLNLIGPRLIMRLIDILRTDSAENHWALYG